MGIVRQAPVRRTSFKVSEETRRAAHLKLIGLHLQLVEHALACSSGSCRSKNCAKLKEMLRHLSICKVQKDAGCVTCQRAWMLLKIYNRHRHRVAPNPLRPKPMDEIVSQCSELTLGDSERCAA
mmetsp:Transcript_17060/g.53276  ORF Transcript_17060/g.53276 Transcript_17060/m.53276 type:complete len:124 (+) Transcript_17060:182-553(+)